MTTTPEGLSGEKLKALREFLADLAMAYRRDAEGVVGGMRNRMIADAENCEQWSKGVLALAARQEARPLPAEAVAWTYELANYRKTNGEYTGWEEEISFHQPLVPPNSIRNLRPLFAHPPSSTEERLREARANAVNDLLKDSVVRHEMQAALSFSLPVGSTLTGTQERHIVENICNALYASAFARAALTREEEE